VRCLAGSATALAFGLTACAGADRGGSPDSDFARYRMLPHYRAMAVTGGTLAASSYASGWSSAATSIDGAVEVALRECDARREPSVQPPCALYAIGDLVVPGADAATLARAECVYILDPAARSREGGHADACAAVAARQPGSAAAMPGPGHGPTLDASEVQDRIVGNTLASDGAAFIHVARGGTAVLRTADRVFSPDQGTWRVQPDGRFCLRWQRARAGRELCHHVKASGNAYELGDLRFSVIDDNPFAL
jgi:hypothetical protein